MIEANVKGSRLGVSSKSFWSLPCKGLGVQGDHYSRNNERMTAMMETDMVMANNTPQTISSEHSDYILSTALDVYGRRLATCSGDRQIKIWESDGSTWKLNASWQAHRSAVTSVAWAHPEYGTLLASGSSDHACKVWQEDTSTTPTKQHSANGGSSSNPMQSSATTNSPYVAKAVLTEAPRTVTCVQFAPRHWGLKLATGSADGTLRIYEAVDVSNVSQWPIAASLESPNKDGITCLSWWCVLY